MSYSTTWFYHRLRSMSLPELVFRAGQMIQKRTDRSRIGWRPSVALPALPEPLLPFNPAEAPPASFSGKQPVFRHTIDIDQPIDWHLDVSTGQRFPLTYAKDADVRSGHLSAKYVWEINRLLFLPQLAVLYRQAGPDTEAGQGYLAQFVALNRSWFAANPYLTGVNWYSNIEVNIRLINWFVSWNILDASALAQSDADFRAFVETEWLPVIYQHCVYSRRNPSRYSSGNNHLVSEYAGLFVAASFWSFPESDGWKKYTQVGLEREMQRQHTASGINREEAAEYIQFITDFFLIALVVGERLGQPFSDDYKAKLDQIFEYIAQFLDGWGTFPRYGDEDDGRVLLLDDTQPGNNFQSLLRSGAVLYQKPLFKQRSAGAGTSPRFDLKNYVLFGAAGRASFDGVGDSDESLGSVLFEEGHVILRKQERTGCTGPLRETYIHVNTAPLGFLSIAAHGHADALSFLLHVDGQVILADPGTYSYQTDAHWRNYFVSTRAHNTVCIDGQNQAFQGGAMLWLRHYKTRLMAARSQDNVDEISATHTGYERLHCRHQRTFRFEKDDDLLLLTDTVENYGQQTRLVEVLFHLGPDVRVETLSRNHFLLTHPGTDRRTWLTVAPALRTEVITGHTGQDRPPDSPLGWYSAGFYQKQPTATIRAFLRLGPGKTSVLDHQIDIQKVTLPATLPANMVTARSAVQSTQPTLLNQFFTSSTNTRL